MEAKFCPACGQKRAERLSGRTIVSEAWERLRLFEADLARSAFRVVLQPGVVAREYVLGARKKHVHPLKLLLTAIVVLVLLVNQTGYLQGASAQASRAMELVRTYAQWSFSLGVLAIFLASVAVFWLDRAYRMIELAVLAIYTHFAVLVFNIANLAPLLVFSGAEAVQRHKFWSAYYKDWAEGAIVLIAFAQFFEVDWRRQWWRPLLAAVSFVLLKKAIIQAGAQALVRLIFAGWL
jgi:hypothetical protein